VWGGSPGGGKVLLKLVGGNVLGEVSGGRCPGGDVRNRYLAPPQGVTPSEFREDV